MQKFETYEEVTRHLLDKFSDKLGLTKVDKKQLVEGKSGTDWEIDAKGICEGNAGFVVVECKRLPTSKMKQSQMATLAYEIEDTGAKGGIVVTPLELQKGASKVAEKEGIVHAKLDADSTANDFVLQFLNNVMIGVSDKVSPRNHVQIVVKNEQGTIVSEYDSTKEE
jgi:hypothetical protein